MNICTSSSHARAQEFQTIYSCVEVCESTLDGILVGFETQESWHISSQVAGQDGDVSANELYQVMDS